MYQESSRSTDLVPGFERVVHSIGFGLEVVGIGVIVLGGLIASFAFLRGWWEHNGFGATYHHFRANLGRAILLGLEFLVAADIIRTVAIEPTFQNFGVLGVLVVIRTFLSFALEVEIDGHWPWEDTKHRGPGSKREAL